MVTVTGSGGYCSQNNRYVPASFGGAAAASGGQEASRRITRRAKLKPRHGRDYSSSTTNPSRMVTRRSICAASSILWVAMMAAMPEARTN